MDSTTKAIARIDRKERTDLAALDALLEERIGWMGLPFEDYQRRQLKVWLKSQLWWEWPSYTARACLDQVRS